MQDGSAAEGFLSLHARGVPLPAGLRPESLAFLARLAGASAARDEADRQVALAARRRAGEHARELEEVEDSLRQCGLAPGSLPTAVSGSLGGFCRGRALSRSDMCVDWLSFLTPLVVRRNTVHCSGSAGSAGYLAVQLVRSHRCP